MTVIKRDGRIQDFDIDKLRLSIEHASDNAKAPMSSSDLDLVVKDVFASIASNGIEPLHTHSIRKHITDSLEKFGFSIVAKYYNDKTNSLI